MVAPNVQRDSKLVQGVGHMAHHTDTLNKTVKTAEQGVKLVQTVAGLIPGGQGFAAGLGFLSVQLKTTKTVLNATNIFERGYEWGMAKSRNNILQSTSKIFGRATLTAAQFIETALFVDKCALGFFTTAAMTVCHLPILEVVKSALYISAAIGGLCYAGSSLAKAGRVDQKLQKWQAMEADEDSVAAMREKYQARVINTKYESKRPVYEEYLNAINNGEAQQVIEHKARTYETRHADLPKVKQKNWLSIAVDVGKIVMITLGMFVAATSLMFPVLSLPAAVLVMTSLSLVSNAMGLAKNLYSEIGPKEERVAPFQYATVN